MELGFYSMGWVIVPANIMCAPQHNPRHVSAVGESHQAVQANLPPATGWQCILSPCAVISSPNRDHCSHLTSINTSGFAIFTGLFTYLLGFSGFIYHYPMILFTSSATFHSTICRSCDSNAISPWTPQIPFLPCSETLQQDQDPGLRLPTTPLNVIFLKLKANTQVTSAHSTYSSSSRGLFRGLESSLGDA